MKPETFDLTETPLEGINLIEASAGTGKTYAISGLFLRLLLEKNLTIDQILVVTFTEAATEELKDRIRNKLRETVAAFSGGRTEEKFIQSLIRKYKREKPPEHLITSLQNAIRDFDEAAIFTIHSFCKRMLHEHAFESGTLFDTELVGDQERLKREIVEDFWRTHFYDESRIFVNYLLDRKISPESLLFFLRHKLSQPDMHIVPRPVFHQGEETSDASYQEREYRVSFDAAKTCWLSEKDVVEHILMTDEGLNRNQYRRTSIPAWVREMDDYLHSGEDRLPIPDKRRRGQVFEKFEKFTRTGLRDGVKKKFAPPAHRFFDRCEDLKEKKERLTVRFDKRLLDLKIELFRYVKAELQKRKETQNILSFDDLLLNLQVALRKEGESLAEKIRTRFRAALIDEFQDTDPVQYDIFKRIFGSRLLTPDSDPPNEAPILFLIGDPKQAIYGFRGADIFAYMDAAEHSESRYTLGENWRSEPSLIQGVNTIFENAPLAFLYEEIPFFPVRPAKDKKHIAYLKINRKSDPPLQFWFLKDKEGGKKTMGKEQARKLIYQAVAGEISRLLDKRNKVSLGGNPLKPGDIAVLVRQKRDAAPVQKRLSELGIPAVLHTEANLFDSHEAVEMERVLSAILHSGNERLLMAALATDMMGVSGERLNALAEDEREWEEWLVKFRNYHHIWHSSGFIQMFRQLASQEKILPRLMAFPNGERRNTNLLHLSEILHQVSLERKGGMAWLVKWLSDQRDQTAERLKEYQLRLESDENAVKLVTIHKSKGLEYPVVFCPFMFGDSKIRDKDETGFLFHDEENDRRLTLDIGSEDMEKHQKCSEQELLAENLRLLYVALTRAENRCYLVWGRIKDAGTSALAYLLHHPGGSGADVLSTTEMTFEALSDAEVRRDVKAIEEKSLGAIRVSDMPADARQLLLPLSEDAEKLDNRKFSGKIGHHFRVASFSSLTSGRAHGSELADHDAQTGPEIHEEPEEWGADEDPLNIFSFPKGARAGTFLHEVFEHFDFTEEAPSVLEGLVSEKLREYDFDPVWENTICDTVRKTLSVPLEQERADFTLSKIRNEDRLNELAFYFPLNRISPQILRHIFETYAGDALPQDFPEYIERLEFSPVRGVMKGFVDMVFQFQEQFYLVDWKSNFLGSRVEDYHQYQLIESMKENYYILQYHIYALALHRYLFVRKPGYTYEKDFGGVYYIFLRGVDPEKGPDFGIYRDRPSRALMEALSCKL